MRSALNILIMSLVISPFFMASCISKSGNGRDANPVSSERKGAGEFRAKGEYIVTAAQGSDESLIRQYLSQHEIIEIKSIRKNVFLVKLKNDPGIEKIKAQLSGADEILKIQPNYKYRSF